MTEQEAVVRRARDPEYRRMLMEDARYRLDEAIDDDIRMLERRMLEKRIAEHRYYCYECVLNFGDFLKWIAAADREAERRR
jgi:hypothetical protein